MNESILSRLRFDNRKDDRDDFIYLRIIGAGLPRTGTTSLRIALELLGFGPCHHMSDLFDKSERSIQFAKALDEDEVDFRKLMEGYGSTVDAPTAEFYKELHRIYPKAKIVLTVRDNGEQWFQSVENTVGHIANDIFYYIAVYPIRAWRLQWTVNKKIFDKWIKRYGGYGPQIHDLHNARVIRETREDDLLIFNVKEGWYPLCKFLHVPIPEDIPFPHVNDTKRIQRWFRKAKIIGWTIWISICLVIGVITHFFLKLIT